MSLRQRLAIGFVLFSALPLAGFAVYSYAASRAAIEDAARAEAEWAARELTRRVGLASGEIETRFRSLAKLPASSWSIGTGEAAPADLLESAVADLGPAVAFIEDLRFVPPAPEAPAAAGAIQLPAEAAIGGLARFTTRVGGVLRSQGELDAEQIEAIKAELGRVHIAIAQQVEETKRAALEAKQRQRLATAGHPAPAPPPAPPSAPETIGHPDREAAWLAPLAEGKVVFELAEGDRPVGRIEGKLKAKELLASVLAQTDRDRGEIPFAIDREEQLYVASAADGDRLRQLPALAALRAMPGTTGEFTNDEWIVLARRDAASGFRFGIARPLGAAIADLRVAMARNLLFGGGLIALMLAGFFPLTSTLVRDVRRLERGADAIAAGDLDARVELRRSDEIGKLGQAFNHMAEQIAEHRDRLLAEERRRKEDEIARRLLAAENERRGRELEEARDFQLSLLPRELPRVPDLDLAVEMATATEVGGDYYDFQIAPDGTLVMAIGDATGHGAAAGTMVTAVKSLFAAAAASQPPAEFLAAANAAIHRMGLTRRAMALSVARVAGREVELSAAGMPPLLHFRASDGRVEEVTLPGTPLGARADFPYAGARLTIGDGDALLLLSDGLPELPNADGEPFGYERVRLRFAELARTGDCAAALVAGLRAAMREWGGDRPPVDDVTLLVLAARDGASLG